MLVSILIPTCKTKENVAQQIGDIKRTVPPDCEVIASCLQGSASVNRNYCLNHANGDIIVMMDDDITRFYNGWLIDLIRNFGFDMTLGIVSARLLRSDGNYAFMMGDPKVYTIPMVECTGKKVCTACIAFRKTPIRFDENFQGSGFEDDDFSIQFRSMYPDKRILINNQCKLVHLNEMKNQGGIYWKHNKAYFLSKYPNEKDVWHD